MFDKAASREHGEDTRQAVAEARSQGLVPFCLTFLPAVVVEAIRRLLLA